MVETFLINQWIVWIRHENIRKIATSKCDDYTTGCLLDYPYFKENYKMIAIDLSRQNELDAYPRAIQQINFTANLGRAGNTTKRNYFWIFTGHHKSFVNAIEIFSFLNI